MSQSERFARHDIHRPFGVSPELAERAIGFYRHVGFTEVPAADVHILVMDLQTAGTLRLAFSRRQSPTRLPSRCGARTSDW